MSNPAFVGGKIIMKDGKVAVGAECCCGCPCDCANFPVAVDAGEVLSTCCTTLTINYTYRPILVLDDPIVWDDPVTETVDIPFGFDGFLEFLSDGTGTWGTTANCDCGVVTGTLTFWPNGSANPGITAGLTFSVSLANGENGCCPADGSITLTIINSSPDDPVSGDMELTINSATLSTGTNSFTTTDGTIDMCPLP